MAFRLNQQDIELLTSIAEYRVLCVRQIVVIHQRNPQSLRRRLRHLNNQGLVQIASRGFGKSRGRPEQLVSMSEAGADLLQGKKLIDPNIPTSHVTADRLRCLDHLLLINDFRAQLTQMHRIDPALSVRFLSSTSPSVHRSPDDRPLVHEKLQADDMLGQRIEFTPDGVFAITHTGLTKTLLFFVEVDMGTETLASPQRSKLDVRQKIINYRAYFRLKQYKRYEQIWDCPLNGFRLLFITHSPGRLTSLCRLVRDMPPSDFIWLTDRQSLLSKGAWGAIWNQGGRHDIPPQSILGSKTPKSFPTPITDQR